MCRVLNKHHSGVPARAVYIGRGSKWGNPFRIGAPTATARRSLQNMSAGSPTASAFGRARRAVWPRSRLLLRAAAVPRRSAASARERDAGGAYRVVARREGGGPLRARAWPGRD